MSRKSLFFLCLGAISVFVIYKLGSAGFDWSLFVASLWNVQPAWLAASVGITMLTYVVRAFRWQLLLNPLKVVPMRPLISTNVLGFSAIYLIGRPGEFVRPLWLTRTENIPLTASLATIVVERVLDMMMLVTLFGLALLLVDVPASAQNTLAIMKQWSWVLVGGSVFGMICLFIFRAKSEWIIGYVPIERAKGLLKHFSEGLSFLDKGRTFGLALAHSAIVWIVIVLQFWTMLLGMKFQFSVSAATLIMVGAAIGSIVQVPGIGGGFQGGYIFCMTTFFAIPAEQAIASSLIAWVSQYVPTVLAGGWYMISHGLSLKDLRTATAE